jgi:beta-mannosidase
MRDLDDGDWMECNIPASVYVNLIEAGRVVKSDLYACPEKFGYVSEKPWVYSKKFDVSSELLQSDAVHLVFEGLDTIASVWLNSKLIGKTNNMFIPYRFDVTKLIKGGDNRLVVKFAPAVGYAKKLMSRYGRPEQSEVKNPWRVFVRKAQFQFGWDFCPSLCGCGIWRPARLEALKRARISDLHVRTIRCSTKSADIKVDIGIDALATSELLCLIDIASGEMKLKQELIVSSGQELVSTVIRIENPSLWWPAGYGVQSLYQLSVKLVSENEVVDQKQENFGIRASKLEVSGDEYGQRFKFHINGRAIFVKGADWVPASIFAGSVSNEQYENLLRAAAEANINMLRVWGGGHYETDKFYSLCDQLGIMVWQDFMFACAYYPDNKWFTEQVAAEAEEVIKRLRNHPSLVLWCGNNEIDWMHQTGKFGRGRKFYGRKIYHRILPGLVSQLNPDTDYIPSTPFAPAGSHNLSERGAIHQWDVWTGHKPVAQYRCPSEQVPCFVTEFGMQSLPNIGVVKTFGPAEKLRISSLAVEKHNYQIGGNSRLYRYVGDLFGTTEQLKQFIYLSQVTQGRAVKTYVEHLRAHRQRNSGLLFWQFNDCFASTSWSSIDYNGEPKALYYYARRFYSPLLVTAIYTGSDFQDREQNQVQPESVVVINDTNRPLTAVLRSELIDLSGSVIDRFSLPIALGPHNISSSFKLPRTMMFPAHPEKSLLYLAVERDGKKIVKNTLLYLPDKYINWPYPRIITQIKKTDSKRHIVKLSSDCVVKDLQISAYGFRFCDNYLDIIPPNEVEIVAECGGDLPPLKSILRLRNFCYV